MESCIHTHLFNYISRNNLLTPFQSGFIPGDSITNQLLHIYHMFCEAVDNGKDVRVVFCDINKAFDRLRHKGLLYKLAAIEILDSLLRWFTSYLSGRRQRVVVDDLIGFLFLPVSPPPPPWPPPPSPRLCSRTATLFSLYK